MASPIGAQGLTSPRPLQGAVRPDQPASRLKRLGPAPPAERGPRPTWRDGAPSAAWGEGSAAWRDGGPGHGAVCHLKRSWTGRRWSLSGSGCCPALAGAGWGTVMCLAWWLPALHATPSRGGGGRVVGQSLEIIFPYLGEQVLGQGHKPVLVWGHQPASVTSLGGSPQCAG